MADDVPVNRNMSPVSAEDQIPEGSSISAANAVARAIRMATPPIATNMPKIHDMAPFSGDASTATTPSNTMTAVITERGGRPAARLVRDC